VEHNAQVGASSQDVLTKIHVSADTEATDAQSVAKARQARDAVHKSINNLQSVKPLAKRAEEAPAAATMP